MVANPKTDFGRRILAYNKNIFNRQHRVAADPTLMRPAITTRVPTGERETAGLARPEVLMSSLKVGLSLTPSQHAAACTVQSKARNSSSKARNSSPRTPQGFLIRNSSYSRGTGWLARRTRSARSHMHLSDMLTALVLHQDMTAVDKAAGVKVATAAEAARLQAAPTEEVGAAVSKISGSKVPRKRRAAKARIRKAPRSRAQVGHPCSQRDTRAHDCTSR
jgi:hypothetical protein